ncbi:hypothetical protein RFI_04004 [Reticulomyxa filosa]|uniref:Uncharacterized protein n=1 Tax=Reticulomyxa filosa TaxID=46433 RepID=X6P661_RETFI|nr:hypothetical protein RFI_04004 [Reticulomyxa filosa]|eukprot:ETO33102.1 hypothetical protein RFI_04004 [Reticulomyxa filosa]
MENLLAGIEFTQFKQFLLQNETFAVALMAEILTRYEKRDIEARQIEIPDNEDSEKDKDKDKDKDKVHLNPLMYLGRSDRFLGKKSSLSVVIQPEDDKNIRYHVYQRLAQSIYRHHGNGLAALECVNNDNIIVIIMNIEYTLVMVPLPKEGTSIPKSYLVYGENALITQRSHLSGFLVKQSTLGDSPSREADDLVDESLSHPEEKNQESIADYVKIIRDLSILLIKPEMIFIVMSVISSNLLLTKDSFNPISLCLKFLIQLSKKS